MPRFLIPLILVCLSPSLAYANDVPSLFSIAGKPADVAQQVLDFVFLGKSTFFSDVAAQRLHNAIQTLFIYYGGAMLVFAMFIVFYHIAVMVGESAHYGVPLGKRGKQLWTPIRLVIGLGLLIPIGGFSGAQYIIIQMTRAGSALASNAWNAFADEVKAKKLTLHGTAIYDPTATIAHLVATGICIKSYEIIYSGLPVEKMMPFVMNSPFLVQKSEPGKNVSRLILQARLGTDSKLLPVTCGELSWLEPDLARDSSTMNKVGQRFAKAHLEAIKSVQLGALDLGGGLALGSLGITNAQASYGITFAKLVEDYRKTFLLELRADGITIGSNGSIAAYSEENTPPIGPYGWLMAGTALQKFALTDTVLITPELSVPVVNFHYPLFAATNDKATLQLARGLSFAHLLLQPYDPDTPDALWFNPTIDHGKGPVKQALTLTANILARHDKSPDGRNLLATGLEDSTNENIGLFKPIAMGFKALDIADQFWAVAEWSSRANSPVFGPAIIFGNLAQSVKAALLAANPKIDTALFGPQSWADIDQPADFARYLIAALGLIIFVPAILLVFLLPLIPMLHFAYGGLIWLMAVFQGIAAAPLWALTFLSTRGDEMIPPGARLGVALILNIFLRPILMVVGFITALLLMHVGFGVLEISLQLFSYDGLQGTRTLYSLGTFALLLISLLLSFAIANGSMKCISLFPEFTLRWLGSAGAGAGGGEDGQPAALGQASHASGAVATATASGGGAAGASGAAQSSQQVWQRKLLSVLEQMAGQNGTGGDGGAALRNSGLFAHLADKPDQAQGAAAGAVQATNANATNVTVTAAGDGVGSTASGAIGHVAKGDQRERKSERVPSENDPLMAQVVRGNPTDKT